MQAQTPKKAAHKEPVKASPNIIFVNKIPKMFASGIDFPAQEIIPMLTQEKMQTDHDFFK